MACQTPGAVEIGNNKKPIAYDGHAYFVNRSGVLYCLDLETGKEFYAKRLGGGSIWATPVAAGGQVLFFGKGGDVTFVKPGPEFAEIAATRAFTATPAEEKPQEGQRGPASSGPVLYAASVLPDKILVRTGGKLICFGR